MKITLVKPIESDRFINNIYELDKKYLDSDITKDQVKDKIKSKNILVGVDKDDNMIGYSEYEYDDKSNTIKIDWIVAKEGYGTQLLSKLETKWLNDGVNNIILKVSIDPTEDKNIVMRRLNFYIKFNYRVKDIEFREKYGPLLTMHKTLF